MPNLLDGVLDFLLVAWITTSVTLLLQFGWYGIRVWRLTSLREVHNRLSFFYGLLIHHAGNLLLLVWFWLRLHYSDFHVTNMIDTAVIIVGVSTATAGLFYKIRIFSYSGWEMVVTVFTIAVLSAISLLTFHRHWM